MSDMIAGLITSFGGPILERLGAKLALPPSVVKQAVPVVIGMVVASIARLGRTPGGLQQADEVMESAKAQMGSASLNDFIRDIDPDSSGELLKKLIGGNSVENVMGNLSRLTGIPEETCANALGAMAPAILNQLRAAAAADGLDTAGLVKRLGEQGETLQALGNMDYLLDDEPGIGDDIQRGIRKLFGGREQ